MVSPELLHRSQCGPIEEMQRPVVLPVGWSWCLRTFHLRKTLMVSLETLKNIQFLQDFSDDHLQHIASLAEIKEFPAGSVVFREGQPRRRCTW